MVLGLKPLGKPTTYKQKVQVLDRTKALHGPRTPASRETNYLEAKLQVFKKRIAGFRHSLDVIWPQESTLDESYPLIVGLIPSLTEIRSLPSDPRYQGN